MKYMGIIFLVIVCLQAKDAQARQCHPYKFNVEQIMRTHNAYPEGATDQDIKNAIKQAARCVREEEGKESWKIWIQEYHGWVPYVFCMAIGGIVGYVIKSVK